MRIVVLVENTSCCDTIGHVHGLSFYVETPRHKLLFDAGPNALFLENAEKLGVDISAVDLCVLSHGHYDHGGGLPLFLKRNDHAPIYLRRSALGEYCAKEGDGLIDIGLPAELRRRQDRFIFTGDTCVIDEELTLFSSLSTADYLSSTNDSLLEKTDGACRPDPFVHEQDLLICAQGKRVLLAGCAHRGIVNILRRAESLGGEPDAVLAGFHLTDPGVHRDAPEETIRAVGEELLQRKNTVYYTGHCTGRRPFALLSAQMGDRLQPLHSGSEYHF